MSNLESEDAWTCDGELVREIGWPFAKALAMPVVERFKVFIGRATLRLSFGLRLLILEVLDCQVPPAKFTNGKELKKRRTLN